MAFSSACFAQREFRELLPMEGYDAAARLPDDFDQPAELVIGRLMYPDNRGSGWLRGGTSWAVDYPKGDRRMAELLRRFTRTDVRSVEQPVNLEDGDDVYYWPFLVVGLAGNWNMTDKQAAKLREYLLRGGFLYADSFFGSNDWVIFSSAMKRVLPEYPIIDLQPDHPVLNVVYNLTELPRTQIPHMNSLVRGGGGWLNDGAVPHWRGIEDEHGRLLVLIGHNNDTPDSWQWADDPRYPADKATMGMQIGVNVVVYLLTH